MVKANSISSQYWLALVIGNTRLHWGYFYQKSCLSSWHTPHLSEASIYQLQRTNFTASGWQSLAIWNTALERPKSEVFPSSELSALDIWIASAVPQQTEVWAKTPYAQEQVKHQAQIEHQEQTEIQLHFVERSHIPLENIYPTLGIDRAINLLGAGQLAGWPTVVIDAGTAITLTAGVEQAVYGGAILPGLRLQSEALAQKTGALSPFVAEARRVDTVALPERWAMDSAGAIASGLIYSMTATLIDYLNDWWQTFPNGKAFLTGGDAPYLYDCIQQRTPEIASRVLLNSDLMFYGMSAYRIHVLESVL